jgi:AraC-like DNA-binding protein
MLDGVLMSRARFQCHVDQRGNAPRNLRTFALLEEDCQSMSWFGRRVGPEALLVFPTHGEIEVFSRPGFCNHTFSVATDDLAEFFERCGGPDLERVLGPEDTVLPLAPAHLQRLRTHLRKISFTRSTLLRSLALFDAYRDKLFALLLEIFRSEAAAHPSRGNQARRQVIKDVVAVVERCRDERVSLGNLCMAVDVPERTLNETFRRELGISPAAFIKGRRMFGAHRDLWRANPSRVLVSDIANSWGFWHMGQFAADYRRFFGELPRNTLKRCSPPGSA